MSVPILNKAEGLSRNRHARADSAGASAAQGIAQP
jgi:hypothetical protein